VEGLLLTSLLNDEVSTLRRSLSDAPRSIFYISGVTGKASGIG